MSLSKLSRHGMDDTNTSREKDAQILSSQRDTVHRDDPFSAHAVDVNWRSFSIFARFVFPSSPKARSSTVFTSARRASVVPTGALPVRWMVLSPWPERTSCRWYATPCVLHRMSVLMGWSPAKGQQILRHARRQRHPEKSAETTHMGTRAFTASMVPLNPVWVTNHPVACVTRQRLPRSNPGRRLTGCERMVTCGDHVVSTPRPECSSFSLIASGTVAKREAWLKICVLGFTSAHVQHTAGA